MRALALVRYLGADVARSQRWVAPLLVHVAVVALSNAAAGPLLTTYADTSALLLPVAVWLGIIVLHTEDPVQAEITAVSVGGGGRLSLGKLATAWVGSGLFGVVALAWPLVAHSYTGAATGRDVLAGAVAHLLAALFGVAVAAVGMRAVLPRTGLVVLVATGACLADVLVPHAPPARRILELFDAGRVVGLVAVGVETAFLAAALVAGSLLVARWRR